MTDNKVINGLWVGNKLSPMELLTLHSFVAHGHTFHLWVYEPLENDLPKNVILKDANLIVPQSEIFTLKTGDIASQFGKDSLALFADWFRYQLLYQKGGWWVDMDVTCLRKFDIETDYYFSSHYHLPMINNVLKVPKKAPFLAATINALDLKNLAYTTDWLVSNKILNQYVRQYKLSQYIHKDECNLDDWLEIEPYIYSNNPIYKNWRYIHWMNEEWRTQKLSKNAFYPETTITHLLKKYNIHYQKEPRNTKYYFWFLKRTTLAKTVKTIIRGCK